MDTIILAILILTVFYLMGRLVYRGHHTQRSFVFVKVFVTFVLTLAMSAVSLLGVAAVLLSISLVWEVIHMSDDDLLGPLVINTTDLLMMTFFVIFLAAIVHYLARAWLVRRGCFPQLTEEEMTITEYLIQWMTIFLAVYQFMFDGIGEAAKAVLDAKDTRHLLAVALTPGNINLVVQPLLISSWVVIVMEKMRRHVVEADDQAQPPTSHP